MTRLEHIEHDVGNLSPEELAAFRKWFQSYDAARWNRQFEADAASDKLDKLRDEAFAENKARTKERYSRRESSL
jgi:hypothetical protein